MLSIVIPTLNAEPSLESCIRQAREAGVADEIIVVDGGSTDDTCALAGRLGAKVIEQPPGRGGQIQAGIAAASEAWVLVLHADTRLMPPWGNHAQVFMTDPNRAECAAYFRLRFDDAHPAARRIERLGNWRARTFGLPYGDQGLLIQKAFLETLGGYPALPLMEDVAIARRLGRARLVGLSADALTSADKYRRDGWWTRPLKNLTLLIRYLLGTPPERLLRRYQ